jgi:hypothetical protein
MRTVKSLIDELMKFPENTLCYAHEGEVTGVIVGMPNIGYIECCESDEIEDEPGVVYQLRIEND